MSLRFALITKSGKGENDGKNDKITTRLFPLGSSETQFDLIRGGRE